MNDTLELIKLNEELVEKDKEIERLKEEYVFLQNASDEVEEELQQRIDKAIEVLEKYEVHYRPGELLMKDMLLDILKGVDKE